jgi:hypothetical protein
MIHYIWTKFEVNKLCLRKHCDLQGTLLILILFVKWGKLKGTHEFRDFFWLAFLKLYGFIYRKLLKILVPLWSWSYGSWIYNYLCNQCLWPLKLWVWIPHSGESLNSCVPFNLPHFTAMKHACLYIGWTDQCCMYTIVAREYQLIVQYLSKTDHSKLRRTVLCQLVQSNAYAISAYDH